MAGRGLTAGEKIRSSTERLMTLTGLASIRPTETPALHDNLLIGGLQLFAWYFFVPSAWEGYVTTIDPTLHPGFSLSDLHGLQWRNSRLQRLLVKGCLVWMLIVGSLTGLILLVIGTVPANIIFGVVYGLVLGGAGTLVVSVLLSVAAGLAGGVAIGVAFGVILGTTLNASGEMAILAEEYTRVDVVLGVAGHIAAITDAEGFIIAIIAFAIGLSGYLAGRPKISRAIHSWPRRTGGAAIGIIISIATYGLIVFLAVGVSAVSANVGVVGAVFGVAVGLVAGIACSLHTYHARKGVVYGIGVGVVAGIVVFATAIGIRDPFFRVLLWGMSTAAFYSVLFVYSFVLSYRIAGPWAGAVAAALGSGGAYILFLIFNNDFLFFWSVFPIFLILIVLGLSVVWWAPVLLYPLTSVWNWLLYRIEEKRPTDEPSLLYAHSAFWDKYQRLPLLGLTKHILLVAERDADEGQRAIEYLIEGPQRRAAQAAQIELDARRLERCESIDDLMAIHASLPVSSLEGPASMVLSKFSEISQDVSAAINQGSTLRQQMQLNGVGRQLHTFVQELIRSSDGYAARFRPIASSWRQMVSDHVEQLAKAVERRQEIYNPYVVGKTLTEQQEIFVGRTQISAQIAQLILHQGTPPMLLYGQRRMGKTSLLLNLGRLLPNAIVPLLVDLQGPVSLAKDYDSFLYNVARLMIKTAQHHRSLKLPSISKEALSVDPFTRFDEWLDAVEEELGQSTALLMLDEFEALDSAIDRGNFDEESVLGTLRHIIQHRPRFKVLIAGSHTLKELQRWASYLINVQVVKIDYLTEEEARQLIERPVKDFALSYEADASSRVLQLTRCHPLMIQLLCYDIVDLKNQQSPEVRRLATLVDVETAVPTALSRGIFFFLDIENQITSQGRDVLRFMSSHGEGKIIRGDSLVTHFPEDLSSTLDLLLRRDLIEAVPQGYRFQVELIRRWFADQSDGIR